MTMPNTISLEGPARPALSRIGPNAVLQIMAAMRASGLAARMAPLFAGAGATDWFSTPPTDMVDERRVARVHREVRRSMGREAAATLLADAGRRTADYLLANRIPKPVQGLLKIMPPGLAARILVSAIRANAWTFAGSSRFTAEVQGGVATFTLAGNPLCAGETADEPVCVWHAAVFQRLFETLVSPRARVTEIDCEAAGGDACRFEARWSFRR